MSVEEETKAKLVIVASVIAVPGLPLGGACPTGLKVLELEHESE